jgi:hypothetical protein
VLIGDGKNWLHKQGSPDIACTYSASFLGMFIGSNKRSRVLVQAQGDEHLANKKLQILTMLQKHVKTNRREEHAESLTSDEEEQSRSRCFGLVDGADIAFILQLWSQEESNGRGSPEESSNSASGDTRRKI